MAKKTLFLSLLGALGLSLLIAGCGQQTEGPVAPTYKTGLKSEEISNKAFEKLFPAQWTTYQRNELSDVKQLTDFGGHLIIFGKKFFLFGQLCLCGNHGLRPRRGIRSLEKRRIQRLYFETVPLQCGRIAAHVTLRRTDEQREYFAQALL